MGLGLFGGGVGAVRFWCDLGSEVIVTDLRSKEELAPSLEMLQGLECEYVFGQHREEDFKHADLVVVNPAVKPENDFVRLARSAGAEILTEVGLVCRLAHGPLLAVTGSNGKSTTTALLGAMLKAANAGTLVGGNLGGSLLPQMAGHLPSAPIVLELSSAQLHYLRPQEVAPEVAVITNLSPNHLDWHRSVLHYYEAKRNLLRFQTSRQFAVLSHDDEVLREWAEECEAETVLTALQDPGTENAGFLSSGLDPSSHIMVRLAGEEKAVAPLSALQLPGAHNAANALQAAAAAFCYTKTAQPVHKGLATFHGLPHRLEEIAVVRGVTFVNDSISTTPESTLCALQSYDEPKVLIAGGYDKQTPFAELGKAIAEQTEAVVLVGSTAGAIRAAIEDALLKTREQEVASPLIVDAGPDFDNAVRIAAELCPKGGVVLLSPACASYDMFTNFEQRGDVFRRLVENLGE